MPSEVVMLQSKDGLTKKFPLSASSVKLDYQNQVDLSTVTTDYTVPADGVVVTDSGEVTVNKGNIVRNTSSSFCVFIPYRHTIALPDETTAENIIAKDSTGANSTIQNVLDGKADSGYPPLLPEGYTRLEYIKSTGTQYIDTEINDDVVNGEITLEYDYLFGVDTQTVAGFGALGGNFMNYSSGTATVPTPSIQLGASTFLTLPAGTTKFDLSFKFEKNGLNHSVYVTHNGTTQSRQTTYAREGNLTLLGVIYQGAFYHGGNAKLYACVLKDSNNQIIRNFIPCKNPQNVIGLYDTVTEEFYGNIGSGDFVAGSVVPSIPTLKDVNDKINTNNKKIAFVSGVARYSNGSWALLNDNGHAPLNIDSIETISISQFKIYHNINAKKVISLICTPDETYSTDNCICGASVALDNSIVTIKKIDGTVTELANSNIWIMGMFEVE